MPGWFRALTALVLAAACALIAFFTFTSRSLRTEEAEWSGYLNATRQRQPRQQMEYDTAAESLPQLQAELDEVQPQADAAAAQEAAMRQERKEKRAVYDDLQQRLIDAQAAAQQLAEEAALLLTEAVPSPTPAPADDTTQI